MHGSKTIVWQQITAYNTSAHVIAANVNSQMFFSLTFNEIHFEFVNSAEDYCNAVDAVAYCNYCLVVEYKGICQH